LPDVLTNLRAPADFELIGTAVRGDSGLTTVAFRTDLAGDEAFAAMLGSLETDGWTLEADQSSSQTFNVTGQPVNGTVCRDSERMSLIVQNVDDIRYASINSYVDQRALECGVEDPRLALRGPGMFEAMRTAMPRLEFPASTRPADGRGGLGGGMSGSGDTVSTSSRIESPDSAAILAEHLAGQLSAQGWRRDAAWSGSLSAGSTWTRNGNDGRPSWGTLEIVSFGDDIYEVGFMLVSQPL
jgi:hypothetical protein